MALHPKVEHEIKICGFTPKERENVELAELENVEIGTSQLGDVNDRLRYFGFG